MNVRLLFLCDVRSRASWHGNAPKDAYESNELPFERAIYKGTVKLAEVCLKTGKFSLRLVDDEDPIELTLPQHVVKVMP